MDDFLIKGTTLIKYTGQATFVRIPNGITKIEKEAFCSNKTLEKVIFPNSLLEIGDSAFFGCENLKEAIIPDSVTTIGARAFFFCLNLEKIKLPEDLTEIQYRSLARTGIKNLVIPKNVKRICSNSLPSFRVLESVTLLCADLDPSLSALSVEDIPKIHAPKEWLDEFRRRHQPAIIVETEHQNA